MSNKGAHMTLDERILEAVIGTKISWDKDTPMPNFVEKIKQAFADEGYVHLPQGQVGKLDGVEIMSINGKEVMNGQEWYDRFEKNIYLINPPDFPSDVWMRGEILEAAKRAAGLEEHIDG